jgi:hypothetical protein
VYWSGLPPNASWLELHCLPAYSPELNAAEPLWHHTRVHATHNRSFKNTGEILDSLERTFHGIQKQPQQIFGYLRHFNELMSFSYVRSCSIPGLGHFETGSPFSPCWPVVRSAIESLLETSHEQPKEGEETTRAIVRPSSFALASFRGQKSALADWMNKTSIRE